MVAILSSVSGQRLSAIQQELPQGIHTIPVFLRGIEAKSGNKIYTYEGSNGVGILRYFFQDSRDGDLNVSVFRNDIFEGIGTFTLKGELRKENGVIAYDESFMPNGVFYSNSGLWVAQRWGCEIANDIEEQTPVPTMTSSIAGSAVEDTPDRLLVRKAFRNTGKLLRRKLKLEELTTQGFLSQYEFHDDGVIVESENRYPLSPLMCWIEKKTQQPQRSRIVPGHYYHSKKQGRMPVEERDYMTLHNIAIVRGHGIPRILPPDLRPYVRVNKC
jgi:hypothetical protein